MPIYLLPLDDGVPLAGGDDEVALTLTEVPGFELHVLPNSTFLPCGQTDACTAEQCTGGLCQTPVSVSVTQVHSDKIPMTPMDGLQPRFIITIQPAGVHFDPPAPICLPNADGLTPGEMTNMYSFDHDLGRFVVIGPGTVTEDGSLVCSDPGFGIIKGGWHCAGPTNPQGFAEPAKATITSGKDHIACADKDVSFTASGSPSPGTMTWSGGGTPPTANGLSFTTRFATGGDHTVTATWTCESGEQGSDDASAKVGKIDSVTVETEIGLTEAMEGRIVTFTAKITGTIPDEFKPIEYVFHFQRADGSKWTATVISFEQEVDYDAVADDVPDGNADHFFDTPIFVEAKLKGCDFVQSPTIMVRVFELWIKEFKHAATGKDWKVVVGENIQFEAIASSDCTNWDWDMEDGVPDAWNPTGGTFKKGTGIFIPYSDLGGFFGKNGDDFGEAFGTVNVFCEDGEGNNHRIFSTDLDPSKKASVFFDPQKNVDGGAPSQSKPPLWYRYWKNGACPSLDEFAYKHFSSYGSSQVLEGFFWDTHILNVGIPAAGTHYPSGLLVNGVQYGGATGIDCCAEIAVHEKHHNVLAVETNAGAADTDPPSPGAAHTGDFLPDSREPGLGTSTANKDTFNLQVIKSPVYVGYGDNEYSALVTGRGAKGVAGKDWSKGGRQW